MGAGPQGESGGIGDFGGAGGIAGEAGVGDVDGTDSGEGVFAKGEGGYVFEFGVRANRAANVGFAGDADTTEASDGTLPEGKSGGIAEFSFGDGLALKAGTAGDADASGAGLGALAKSENGNVFSLGFIGEVGADLRVLLRTQGESASKKEKGEGWVYESLGDFPSIHRLRWGDFDGDGKPDLAIAPIFGKSATGPDFQQEGARLEVLFGGSLAGRSEVDHKLVTHAIGVIPGPAQNRTTNFLSASNEGIWQHGFANQKWENRQILVGAGGERPKTGCSEIHLGKFADGRHFYATIEPWHGSDVVIQPERTKGSPQLGPRFVIDTTLKEAHALCVADIDGDGTDEVFAGYRGPGFGLNAYRLEAGTWKRLVIDSKIASQDLRTADINGDGLMDVVSVGGSTKNVVLYQATKK